MKRLQKNFHNKMRVFLIPFLFLSFSVQAKDLSVNSIHMVDHCVKTNSDKIIYFVKQWHLSPTVDTTKIESSTQLPQYKNQFEIFSAISKWVAEKKIDTAIAEGCEGEINSKFKEIFNGWNMDSLTKEVNGKNFDSILTHVLMKAESKFPEKLKTLCGDDLSQIKYAQLALSDLRGDVGYWKRIVENEKNPVKLKIYLDGVIEMLKLPSTTDSKTALLALKKDVLSSFKKFTDANTERDAALVRAIKNTNSKTPLLIVYGGLHSEDLKNKFQNEKWNCEIYEPKSYENNEEKLLDEFKKIIN